MATCIISSTDARAGAELGRESIAGNAGCIGVSRCTSAGQDMELNTVRLLHAGVNGVQLSWWLVPRVPNVVLRDRQSTFVSLCHRGLMTYNMVGRRCEQGTEPMPLLRRKSSATIDTKDDVLRHCEEGRQDFRSESREKRQPAAP